jgi:hypothetical protein
MLVRRQVALRLAAPEGKTVMQFRQPPAQSGNRKVVLIGLVAAAIAAAAIAGDDRVSAMLAGAALLGVGLLLVLPLRNPAA